MKNYLKHVFMVLFILYIASIYYIICTYPHYFQCYDDPTGKNSFLDSINYETEYVITPPTLDCTKQPRNNIIESFNNTFFNFPKDQNFYVKEHGIVGNWCKIDNMPPCSTGAYYKYSDLKIMTIFKYDLYIGAILIIIGIFSWIQYIMKKGTSNKL